MKEKPLEAKNYVEMVRPGKRSIQIWRSWVEGTSVITQWGMLDGKMQETIDVPGPKGKPGTKGFVSPEQSARDTIIREITTKSQRGYVLKNEIHGEIKNQLEQKLSDVRQDTSIDFEGPLPQNVAFSKPVNSIDTDRLKKLAAQVDKDGFSVLDWTIKINGMCFVISKDKHGKTWIQNRGKLIVENEKFPHLVKEFDQLLPKESIMLAEFYVNEGYAAEDFSDMQSIANSLPERAVQMQEKLGLVKAYVFRIPAWRGEFPEGGKACIDWLNFIEGLYDGWTDKSLEGGRQHGFLDTKYVRGIVRFEGTYNEAMECIKREGFEGFVVYLRNKPLGEKAISFLGQPDRPAVCWKVKPIREDDFWGIWEPKGEPAHCSTKCAVADMAALQEQRRTGKCSVCGKKLQTNGSFGTGKNRERVGSISLYQIDKTGIRQYICEVSGGLSDQQRDEIAKDGLFVGVLQIGYQDRKYLSRGQISNALSHPKILSIREDKDLNECVNPEL